MIISGEGSKTMSESEEQICLFRWAQWACCKYPELKLLFHVPNEGKRSVYTGARMRSEGLRAGVPDICLPVAKKRYHGLFVEMKARKNKPTRKPIRMAFVSRRTRIYDGHMLRLGSRESRY